MVTFVPHEFVGGSGSSIKPESWVPIPEMGTEQPHFGQSGVVFLDFYMFN